MQLQQEMKILTSYSIAYTVTDELSITYGTETTLTDGETANC